MVHGHKKIALLLAPLSDPKKYNHRAFFKAVEQGWADVLDILIPKCDPSAEESLALVDFIAKERFERKRSPCPVSQKKKASKEE